MSFKKILASLTLLVCLSVQKSGTAGLKELEEYNSEELMDYARTVYDHNLQFPSGAITAAVNLCNNPAKSIEQRAGGCYAAFLLRATALRRRIPILEEIRGFTASINSLEEFCGSDNLANWNEYKELVGMRLAHGEGLVENGRDALRFYDQLSFEHNAFHYSFYMKHINTIFSSSLAILEDFREASYNLGFSRTNELFCEKHLSES